jgi:hypothetical protein
MKSPESGFNREESYHEYFNTEGKVKFGLKDLRFFFEKLGSVFNIDGKLVNQVFSGTINLCNDVTHYSNWTANSNAEVTIANNPITCGGAEIRMIGDGTHTPLFTAFVKSSGSADFDPTLNKVNKVVFYYDGTSAFYSITVL